MTRNAKLLGLIGLLSAPLSLLSGCGNKCSSVFDCKAKELCYFGTCTPAQEEHLSCTADDDCGKVPMGSPHAYQCVANRCHLNPNYNGTITPDAGSGDVALIDIGPRPDTGPIDSGPDSGIIPDSGPADTGTGPNDSGPDPCTLPTTAAAPTGFNGAPGPTAQDYLGVYGRCANDVWAVGAMGTISHWDGTSWIAVPNPATGSLVSVFSGQWNDTWAVGLTNTVLHWDGNAFTSAAPAGFAGDWNSVWGRAPNDVYFAGSLANLWHWDGAMVTNLNIPVGASADPLQRVFGVGTGTAAVVFAAGGCAGTCGRIAIAYSNAGGAFAPIAIADPATGAAILGIWGASPTDVWFMRNGSPGLHWTGTVFDTPLSVPPQGTSLSGSAGTDIYGAAGTGVTHYDGTQWTGVTVPAPAVGGFWDVNVATSTTGATSVWAVGTAGNLRHGP